MDTLKTNASLWERIRKENLCVQSEPINCIFTPQLSVQPAKVALIQEFYRAANVLIAPPTGFISPDEQHIWIEDGNHRAYAMFLLMRDEGFVQTCDGLLIPRELADQSEVYVCEGFMQIAIVSNRISRPGSFYKHISQLEYES